MTHLLKLQTAAMLDCGGFFLETEQADRFPCRLALYGENVNSL